MAGFLSMLDPYRSVAAVCGGDVLGMKTPSWEAPFAQSFPASLPEYSAFAGGAWLASISKPPSLLADAIAMTIADAAIVAATKVSRVRRPRSEVERAFTIRRIALPLHAG